MTTRVQNEKNRRRDMEQHGLDTETVESAAAALERIDDIEGSDGFPLCMLCIGYRVADHLKINRLGTRMTDRVATYTLEEVFQYSTSFLVDETRDTLDTTTTSEAANCRLGDALNVVPQDFTMTLGTSLSETFATLSTAGYENLMSEREQIGQETVH
jgi:hypothetical protein